MLFVSSEWELIKARAVTLKGNLRAKSVIYSSDFEGES